MRRLNTLFVLFLTLGFAPGAAAQDIITTVAGGGPNNLPAVSANLASPRRLAFDAAGNLFIADSANNRVRRVDAATGIITTVAGNGVATFAGDGGLATLASLSFPRRMAFDAAGHLFIADQFNHRIRRVDATTGFITTVAGNGIRAFSGAGGTATSASLASPTGVAFDTAGNLFIADGANRRIRRVDASTGIITTVAGTGSFRFSGDGGPATRASVNFPSGVAFDTAGNLFIADQGSLRIRRVDAGADGLVTGALDEIITTFAGNGFVHFSGDGFPATSASLRHPRSVAFDAAGNLFIADAETRIRRVDAATGIITTVAGNGIRGFSGDGGPATSANLAQPFGVAVDAAGSLFIADTFNSRIRRVILNQPPVADAGPDQTVIVDEVAQLDGTGSSDPDGTIVDFLWDFGDGGTTVGSTAVHAYTTAVTFTVTLTVEDDDGATDTDTTTVFVITIPQGLQALQDQLTDIIVENPGTPLADKLEDAQAKLQTALSELTKTPPDKQASVGNIEGAVGDLQAAVTFGLLDAALGAELMDRAAELARLLAVDAIDQAIARGGNPLVITQAQQALADGDALRASGAFKDAVNKYKDALAKAESTLP